MHPISTAQAVMIGWFAGQVWGHLLEQKPWHLVFDIVALACWLALLQWLGW